MRHEEQVRGLKILMDHLDNDTNVDAGGIRRNPASAYTSDDIAAKEWTSFFRNYPQNVGMSGDLPGSGSFFTRNDFGIPILCTRDKTGKFRAFANVCRHRGAIVEAGERGTKSRFSCPFHAWTYGNDGALLAVPKKEQFGDVDTSCLGLIELPATERHGFLWVHPDKDATLDIDDLLGDLGDEFESWGFDRLVNIGEDKYDTPMNWKLAIDTFGETYHFASLHKNSLFGSFYGNVQAYDIYKRNHRMLLCYRSIDELRDMPEEAWQISMGAFPVYYLFPNIQVNVGPNSVTIVRVYPNGDNPRESFSRISFYAWPDGLEEKLDRLLMFQRGFAEVIRGEDYVAAAQCQIGADSGVQEDFIFGRNEPALHHYHNTYREALGMTPLPLIKS
jgi:phenylpropionate dioxygenase-like ring-hydroxylating dioxygenase large terminal subunit